MLRLVGIEAGYGSGLVLRGVSLDLRAGEVTCLVGRNGAGKTTTLKTVMGLIPAASGRIELGGKDLTGVPAHKVPRMGIGYVPQGRRLFAELSVAENLQIGLMTRGRGAPVRDRMFDLFPVLAERRDQRAGTLSGGEQQMLAIARALCLEPSVMLLDEPTEGLQPSMVAMVRDVVAGLRGDGVAVLLVEQRVETVRTIADHVVFIENGQSRETVPAADLATRPDLLQRYVGVGS